MAWLKKKQPEVEETAPVETPHMVEPTDHLLVTGTGMEPIDAVRQATLPYPNHRPECVRQVAQNALCSCGVG